jgi:hypothetical protein
VKPHFDQSDLDGEVVFDRYLAGGAEFDALQAALSALAPKWSSKLRVWRGPKDQRPIDIGTAGALKAAVVAAAGERGPTYRALVERYGHPPHERLTGSVELRGTGPELVVIVALDETVLSQLGETGHLGNRVSLQVRRPRVNGGLGMCGSGGVREAVRGAVAGLGLLQSPRRVLVEGNERRPSHRGDRPRLRPFSP